MPSKTLKQHNLMEMVAHNPAKAKELKIPQSVGREFEKADKGKKFNGGGMAQDKLKKLFKGKESMKEELAEAKAIKSGKITPMEYAKGEKMEGHCAGGAMKAKKMSSGGKVRGCGIAQKGKTKGKMV